MNGKTFSVLRTGVVSIPSPFLSTYLTPPLPPPVQEISLVADSLRLGGAILKVRAPTTLYHNTIGDPLNITGIFKYQALSYCAVVVLTDVFFAYCFEICKFICVLNLQNLELWNIHLVLIFESTVLFKKNLKITFFCVHISRPFL